MLLSSQPRSCLDHALLKLVRLSVEGEVVFAGGGHRKQPQVRLVLDTCADVARECEVQGFSAAALGRRGDQRRCQNAQG